MKTDFDVAKPVVVSKIVTLTGVHEHLTATLLAEMPNVRGSASFEKCETELNSCILGAFAKEVWKLLCCGDAWPCAFFGKRRRTGYHAGQNKYSSN